MKIIAILLILTLLITGCINEPINNQETGESTTDEFGSDISDLGNFGDELDSFDDLDLDELDF
jgi:PBP1b-binding outer membrane lipoprotein LpoB